MKIFMCVLCLFGYICVVFCSSTEAPKDCSSHQSDCGSCVEHASCMWCSSKPEGQQCMDFPKGKPLPSPDQCPLSEARWGVCWVNYKALIITFCVIGGAILLLITSCCIYCCCCRNRGANRRKYERDMARDERERDERRVRSEERRAERQSKYDEIRKKYGIGSDGITKDDGYNRFENE